MYAAEELNILLRCPKNAQQAVLCLITLCLWSGVRAESFCCLLHNAALYWYLKVSLKALSEVYCAAGFQVLPFHSLLL